MTGIPHPELLPIALRAYAEPPHKKQRGKGASKKRGLRPSEWTLVFDTETTIDSSQQLRIGSYQVRKADEPYEAGLFYDPESLDAAELATLETYGADHGLAVRTRKDFVEEVFFPYAYDLRGTCVGLNLPFDLSRIAVGHGRAKRSMRGGFSFELSKDKRRSRVRVKHLNSRTSLIDFSAPAKQFTPRGMRKDQWKVPTRRGYFVDLRTIAGALLGGSWSLEGLAKHLGVEHQKLDMEEHGGSLTREYLEYAMQDVQATWECYEHLKKLYESYGLSETPLSKIYSEASLGKAYLKQMNVRPWRELQPGFPPRLLGAMMSSYYGGRSEVHIRREVTQVQYCDFLSMYPTVCTLMGLWEFAIAERMRWRDATVETRQFLDDVTIEDLQDPETWKQLRVLVKIQPDGDVFPVRARYEEKGQHAIGLNHLSSEEPMWFTLADCVASKLLTGKSPRVLEALRFEPVGTQTNLAPIDIAGNSDYRVDPHRDDLYKRVIDLRSEVKERMKEARRTGNTAEVARLDAEQKALKLLANATSYGIFVELNVSAQAATQTVVCHGGGEEFAARVRNSEQPGLYFHPLLATLITGAARLMLAMAERLAEDSGLSWAFCDTDSMALAKPDGMGQEDFLERGKRVREWFAPLNPYEKKEELFRLEDANYGIEDGEPTNEIERLYVLAISAKRYALFNLDEQGRPLLRKISAHGLGHLLAPYEENDAPATTPKPVASLKDLEAERWQHDLWYRIVEAALGDTPEQVRLDDLPRFERPAVSRYAATTPKLLGWFDRHNEEKSYKQQVRPFGFLLAYQTEEVASSKEHIPRPVSAYDQVLGKAAKGCFDRETGEPVPRDQLKCYRDTLAQYHLHPESKFHNGEYTDRGFTRRRHVRAMVTECIGKEANRWEEQYHLGLDAEAQTEYGLSPVGRERAREAARGVANTLGQRKLAKAAGVSLSELSAVLLGKRFPNPSTLTKLNMAVSRLQRAEREEAEQRKFVLDEVRRHCQLTSLRDFARRAEIDPANLASVLKGQRKPGRSMLAKLQATQARDS